MDSNLCTDFYFKDTVLKLGTNILCQKKRVLLILVELESFFQPPAVERLLLYSFQNERQQNMPFL